MTLTKEEFEKRDPDLIAAIKSQAKAQGIDKERKRCLEILQACSEEDPKLAKRYIIDGIKPEAVFKILFEKEQSRNRNMSSRVGHG